MLRMGAALDYKRGFTQVATLDPAGPLAAGVWPHVCGGFTAPAILSGRVLAAVLRPVVMLRAVHA